jgi:hypothetical protein
VPRPSREPRPAWDLVWLRHPDSVPMPGLPRGDHPTRDRVNAASLAGDASARLGVGLEPGKYLLGNVRAVVEGLADFIKIPDDT